MINAIGSSGAARAIDALRSDRVKAGTAAAKVAASASEDSAAVATPAASLAAQGAPVDGTKVAAIRQQIAAGTYRVDPQAIADKMIAADLPELQ